MVPPAAITPPSDRSHANDQYQKREQPATFHGCVFTTKRPSPVPYLFSVVGTSRCDVRAACSGATPSNASVARTFVPPATTRAGTAQRAIPTIALNTYGGRRGWRSSHPVGPISGCLRAFFSI